MTRLGHYEVVRQIGEGGFARTYEARHIYLDEKACLKQNINLSPSDTELLRREAKLLWRVHHHSLPSTRDFFQAEDGSTILAMSFIEGRTLNKIIEKHKALHPEEVAWIMQRLLNALHYLHSLGIIHGDVKPPNVIVQPEVHNAVLVDYGLASLLPTRKSKAVGYTPVFVAPEIIEGNPPLPESDLYAVGLTMIYTLGGDPIAKTFPSWVPEPMQEFCKELVRYDPMERPNWSKQDLIARLSDIRLEAFGRRSTLEKLVEKK
ncbi:serine/threonine protein kinase [Candidatus Woesearchaeota archaeon]|nr:serine/threonine protein kinase [Candidatus Woesearchaeota archaeon]